MKPTAAILVMLILTACATPARLVPSGRNSTFAFDPAQPFASYLEYCRQLVQASRTDLDTPNREAIVNANLPFELTPDPEHFPPGADGRYHQGIVLVHGLSDSPYLMRALGEHFRARGFLVRALLLPGHGTRPGDLTAVSEAEWRRAVAYGVGATAPQVEKLFLAGYSTGGALAVDYASEHPQDLAGLILFAPCLKVKSDAARWAGPLSLVKTWLEIRDDHDYAKYESFPLNAAAQIYALTERVRAAAGARPDGLATPTFIAASLEDETVDSAFTVEFFRKKLTNPADRLLLYSADHNPPAYTDPRITVVGSFLPGRKILGLSHTALTLPAEDPHYGSQGDYRNCLHYEAGSSAFTDCAAGQAAWLGERTPANLATGLLQRLTWNPRYTLQDDEIDRFLFALDPPPSPATPAPTASTETPPAKCFCSSGTL